MSKEHEQRKEKKSYIFSVDSFSNGISFGQIGSSDFSNFESLPRMLSLKLADDASMALLRSRFVFNKTDSKASSLIELDNHLFKLSRNGILRSSEIYFGNAQDPFFPFDSKFDVSMKFLEIFKKYMPGMLHVQTRSPLIVLAMPVFKSLGKHCSITIGLETCCEDSASRYTPSLPRVSERLKTIRALRQFGIEVKIQVGPVLPYGDWKSDAKKFAEILVEHADFISVLPITDGSKSAESGLRKNPVALKLAQDRKFHWLRRDSARPLLQAIEDIAPEKLVSPQRAQFTNRQLSIFAA